MQVLADMAQLKLLILELRMHSMEAQLSTETSLSLNEQGSLDGGCNIFTHKDIGRFFQADIDLEVETPRSWPSKKYHEKKIK